ncbi:hypothetical protein BGZ94_003701 [Podila epigama]|nr:hypothetical protein BGZ94_003701 [Podila epigama]
MDHQFPLPLECLQITLRVLVADRACSTLAALLRTQKQVCWATLPFLYQDPFLFFDDETAPCELTPAQNRRVIRLIRTLLLHTAHESLPDLLKVVYLSKKQRNQAMTIDYTQFLRHWDTQSSLGLSLVQMPRPPYSSRMRHCIEALSDEHLFHFRPRIIGPQHSHFANIVAHCELYLLHEVTWAVTRTAWGHLKSMTIPLSTASRYIGAVAHFSVLSSITFRLDEVADTPEEGYWAEEDVELEYEFLRSRRNLDFEAAILLLKRHKETHNSVLRQVFCPEAKVGLDQINQRCPPSYLERMLITVPLLVRPVELVSRLLPQLLAHIHSTDLSELQVIDIQHLCADMHKQLAREQFLERCQSLRKVHIPSLGRSTFSWAVGKQAPPVEEISVHAAMQPFSSELQEIGSSFGASLKTFKALGHGRLCPRADGLQDKVHLGPWNAKVLETLELKMMSEALTLDPFFFSSFPFIQSLDLHDSTWRYDLGQIEVSRPARLPMLKRLHLSGTPALAFHPDTLTTTRQLEVLLLGSSKSAASSWIPSASCVSGGDDDSSSSTGIYIMRPIWTWDWDLPHLVELRLSLEFAYSFKFKLLAKTPHLKHLTLSITSNHELIKRRISATEFTMETVELQQPQNSRQQGRRRSQHQHTTQKRRRVNNQGQHVRQDMDGTLHENQLSVPSLRTLELEGLWVIEDGVLVLMLTKVFSQLETLTESGCKGFSTENWLHVTKKHASAQDCKVFKVDRAP